MSSDFTLPEQCRECVHRGRWTAESPRWEWICPVSGMRKAEVDAKACNCGITETAQTLLDRGVLTTPPKDTILARIDAEAARLVDGGYEITELVVSPAAVDELKLNLVPVARSLSRVGESVTTLAVGPHPPVPVTVAKAFVSATGFDLRRRRKSPSPAEPPETCGTCASLDGSERCSHRESPMCTYPMNTASPACTFHWTYEPQPAPVEPFTIIPYERSNIVTLFEYRIVTLDEDGVIVGMYADPPLDAEGEIFANDPETVVRKAIIRANVSEEELDSVKVLVRPFA